MITFDKVNRRTHLYLGLFLMPWLLMYGLSSLIIIHPSWFKTDKERPWEPMFEREYHRPITDPDLRAAAQAILKDLDLEGAFWANQPKADTLEIDRFSFRDSIRLTYSLKDQKVKAERKTMTPSQTILRLHFRGGYDQPTFWDKFWGLLVDFACIGIILWVASGLLMWWRLPSLRAWGAVAVAGGMLSFLLLVWLI